MALGARLRPQKSIEPRRSAVRRSGSSAEPILLERRRERGELRVLCTAIVSPFQCPSGPVCGFAPHQRRYSWAICADSGSGVATCVPATGCRVAGDWCTAGNDYECCGGSTAGVTCAQNLGDRCDQGAGCGSGSPRCSGICSGTTPTCQPPLQCQPSGGVCAGAQDCCAGLSCDEAMYVPCTGTATCTCVLRLPPL